MGIGLFNAMDCGYLFVKCMYCTYVLPCLLSCTAFYVGDTCIL